MFKRLKIKLAKAHHAKKVAKLFLSVNPAKSPKKVLRYIQKKKVYILTDKKRIRAAFTYSVVSILGFMSVMYIHKLAVMPDLQGQGIGTFILSRIRKNALRAGVVVIFLYSLDKAKRFYEKNHLKRVGRFFWCRPSETKD